MTSAVRLPPVSRSTGARQREVGSDLATLIKSVVEASSSPHTRRLYRSQFKKFASWCRDHGVSALPAEPSVVGAYVVHLAGIEMRSVATVRAALAAIVAAHRSAKLSFDAQHVAIRSAVKGISRTYARPQRQAAPLRPDMLREILDEVGPELIDLRDAALLAVAFGGALRRSELVGLDWDRLGDGSGTISLRDEVIEITLVRSKGRGEADTAVIPRKGNAKLVRALRNWVAAGRVRPGDALFRAIDKGGNLRKRLAPGGIALVIKARIRKYLVSQGFDTAAARREASLYSGHSGRVGMYVAATEAGVAIDAIAAHARHRSLDTAAKYARRADRLKRAPSNKPEVGI